MRPFQDRQPPAHTALVLGVDTATVEAACTTLLRAGFSVETAYSADEALSRMREFKPEVLVADLALPQDEGLKLMRAIIDDAFLSAIKIIGLVDEPVETASAPSGLAVISDELLSKPLDHAAFTHRVWEAVRRRRDAGSATLASWGLS